jgi:hypothetical protein
LMSLFVFPKPYCRDFAVVLKIYNWWCKYCLNIHSSSNVPVFAGLILIWFQVHHGSVSYFHVTEILFSVLTTFSCDVTCCW